jgi:hypothetical protein
MIAPIATKAGHKARNKESPPAAPTAKVAASNTAAPIHRTRIMSGNYKSTPPW